MVRIEITMDAHGRVGVQCQGGNEIVVRGVLGKALEIMAGHWASAADEPAVQAAPAGLLGRLRSANGG